MSWTKTVCLLCSPKAVVALVDDEVPTSENTFQDLLWSLETQAEPNLLSSTLFPRYTPMLKFNLYSMYCKRLIMVNNKNRTGITMCYKTVI